MTDIVWGAEIQVDGKRPEWLEDGEMISYYECETWWGEKMDLGFWTASELNEKPHVTAIRLPSSHWAYSVIEKGFWPWKGGDDCKGPLDYDDGEVIRRDGIVVGKDYFSPYPKDGHENCSAYWIDEGLSIDIIGYRRKQNTPKVVSGDVPQWAYDRLRELSNNESLFDAFARYISAHEQPPADPLYDALYEVVQMGRYDTREQAQLLHGELDRLGYHITKKDT